MRIGTWLLGLLSLAAAAAEPALITTHLATAPRLEVPHAATAPALTAEPQDPAWLAAAVIPQLAAAGGKTAFPTEVRLLWDEHALYLRFTSVDHEIYTPYGQTRDADHYKGDVAELFLDPVGDARQYYEIQVSPEGGVLDLNMLLTGEPLSRADGLLDHQQRQRQHWTYRSWDLNGLRHAQHIVTDAAGVTTGWIVEMAIPAAAVMKRHGGGALVPLSMRANLVRHEWPSAAAGQERELTAMYWAPVVMGCPHISPLAMGELVLLPAAD